MREEALFITFEGIEGVGKSTNITYVSQKLKALNKSYIQTREPGGTALAESIRQLLLSEATEVIYPKTEALLLYAARMQHVEGIIKPALQAQQWVLCDRFFDATLAYQGGGRGMDLTILKQLNQWALQHFVPNLTVLFDAPAEIGLTRIKRRKQLDRIEKEDVVFFERVRQCYLQLAEENADRYRVIDAQLPLYQVQKRIDQILDKIL